MSAFCGQLLGQDVNLLRNYHSWTCVADSVCCNTYDSEAMGHKFSVTNPFNSKFPACVCQRLQQSAELAL